MSLCPLGLVGPYSILLSIRKGCSSGRLQPGRCAVSAADSAFVPTRKGRCFPQRMQPCARRLGECSSGCIPPLSWVSTGRLGQCSARPSVDGALVVPGSPISGVLFVQNSPWMYLSLFREGALPGQCGFSCSCRCGDSGIVLGVTVAGCCWAGK